MSEKTNVNTLSLTVPFPLCDLVRNSAPYCEIACCGLNAFDVNAFTFLNWIKENGAEQAQIAENQLKLLIQTVKQQGGRIISENDFSDKWETSEECAEYLASWRDELDRAMRFFVSSAPTASDRLKEATERGGPHFYLEVRRLSREASRLMSLKKEKEALSIFALIAPLDINDKSIDSDVKWARDQLTQRHISFKTSDS